MKTPEEIIIEMQIGGLLPACDSPDPELRALAHDELQRLNRRLAGAIRASANRRVLDTHDQEAELVS